jgi:hypothetical protein
MMMVPKLDPRIPKELQTSPPRQVRLRGGRGPRIMGMRVFLLPHLLIGIAVMVVVIGEPLWLWGYPAAVGRITSMKQSLNPKGKAQDEVGYIYRWNGRAISDSASVSAGAYHRLQSSPYIKVHALNFGGYQFSELDMTPGEFAASRWFLWPWAIVWNGMLLLMLRQPILAKRLVRYGEPVVGKIVDKKSYRGRSTRYSVRYEYTPRAGEPLQRTMTVSRADFEAASIGKEMVVLYETNHPANAVIYGYGDYSAV